jgi:Mn2+/Fe2+ NRAMP family transporter
MAGRVAIASGCTLFDAVRDVLGARAALVTFAVAAASLPFTFLPLLVVANDADYMGEQKNTQAINAAAGLILGLLVPVTVATGPLFVLTGGGP